MALKLFGFTILSPNEILNAPMAPALVPPKPEGAATFYEGGVGVFGGYAVDFDTYSAYTNEIDLINQYRDLSLQPEVDEAISSIINEMIVREFGGSPISMNVDDLPDVYDDPFRVQLIDAFRHVMNLFQFNDRCHDIARQFYVDGRLYYDLIINEQGPQDGIIELRNIDPRTIRPVREVRDSIHLQTGARLTEIVDEYFLFNPIGFRNMSNIAAGAGIKVAKDRIAYINSGVYTPGNVTVLSHLHKAIKPFNQLRMVEDATVIYRITRAPERRVFYVDVADLPTARAEQYLQNIAARYRNRVVYDSSTGEVRDDRKIQCLDMNTRVPLLDGRTLTLTEITEEFNQGKKLWAYSCNPETGEFVPGVISWAGITKPQSEVMKLTLDNGESVICTPDHKFPVWNKGFVQAKDLSVGESMIPLYRQSKPISGGDSEYEQVYQNDSQEWEYTHRLVSNWKKTVGLYEEWVYGNVADTDPKQVIHHRDFNRNNNEPSNLVMMNYRDHFKYHASLTKDWLGTSQTIQYPITIIDAVLELVTRQYSKQDILTSVNSSCELMDEFRLANKQQHIRNKQTLVLTHKDIRRIAALLGFDTWFELRKQYQPSQLDLLKQSRSPRGSNEWREKLRVAAANRVPVSKTWKITTPTGEIHIEQNLNAFCRKYNLNRNNIKRSYGSKQYTAELLTNHKIVKIEHLSETMPVGTLTIDQNEQYHNYHTFALACGIYTKNSMLEDFFLPRRSNGRGTEIQTLPAGQNLGEMSDVEYFKRKLYRALSIPVSRLESSGSQFQLGRTTEITRDEIQFSRFLERQRQRLATLFDEVMSRHLTLTGVIRGKEEWRELRQYVRYEFITDSYFSELKRVEIMKERLEILSNIDQFVGKYFSEQWVKDNVLRLTTEEQAQIKLDLAQQSAEGEEPGGEEGGAPEGGEGAGPA